MHPSQLGKLEFEFFNFQRFELRGGLGRLQLALAGQREGAQGGGVGRQFGRGKLHSQRYQARG